MDRVRQGRTVSPSSGQLSRAFLLSPSVVERIEKYIRFFYLLSGGVSLDKEVDFIASYFLFFFEQRPIQLGSDEVKNDNRGLKLRFDILEDRERETRLKIG